MAPKLYKMDLYPPVGSIYLTAEAVDLTLDCQEIKVSDEYQLRQQFMLVRILNSLVSRLLITILTNIPAQTSTHHSFIRRQQTTHSKQSRY